MRHYRLAGMKENKERVKRGESLWKRETFRCGLEFEVRPKKYPRETLSEAQRVDLPSGTGEVERPRALMNSSVGFTRNRNLEQKGRVKQWPGSR